MRSIVSERFVFVDECSTNISLSPVYARAPKGERARGKAPRNWGKNVSLVCAIDSGGVKPSMSVEGAVDAEAFESYIEHFLVPELERGQIVVMDNLSVHKSKRVERLVEGAGCELLFLPAYSPDFNPIEEAFSEVKGALRKGGLARGRRRWKRPAALWTPSPPKTSAASTQIAGTAYPCSRCENRSSSWYPTAEA